MTSRYSTILFDFDGTLTPSLHLWVLTYQYAFGQLGVELDGEQIINRCFYKPWEELVDTFKLPSVDAFRIHVHEGLDRSFGDAQLFDGVLEFLDECRERGIVLGIVTSSTRKIVERFLNERDLNKYFGVVVTSDDITNHKPHPEPVLLGMSRLGVSEQGTLFVGDSEHDLCAAAAAGLDSALFFPHEHHTYYDFERLMGHEPGFVFNEYSQLSLNVMGAADLVG